MAALWGHIVLDLDVKMLSMWGLVMLSGVVLNHGLVVVDFINRSRRSHVELPTAVREAAFLVPLAVSHAFGVVFATVITLILTPRGS